MKLSIKRIPAVTPGSVLNAAFSITDESRNKSLKNGGLVGGGDTRYEEKSKLAFYFAPKHVVAFLFDQKISNFTSNVRALCATGPDMTNDEWMNENLHRHQTTQNLTMKLTLMYAQNVDFTIYKSNLLYFHMFLALPRASTEEFCQNYRRCLLSQSFHGKMPDTS